MLKGIEPIAPTKSGSTQAVTGQKSFSEMLGEQVRSVNEMWIDAEKRIEKAVLGEDPNPHATIIAVQKATISFQLLMSVKQKIEQAYQQVIRTSA